MALIETMQDPAELARFIEIVRAEQIGSFLEIGSKFGGTLNAVAGAMEPGSRVVSVDLPFGTRAWQQSSASLQGVISGLGDRGYDVRLLWGDSTHQTVIERVRNLGPFDLIFIDANHTLPYLEKDWANYRPMARKMVAFHDIAWHRASDWVGVRIDVPQFWQRAKMEFSRFEEIRLDPTLKNNGIGVGFI